MDINYELYKVFYHVAATLSFSEASKQLFISQSAVSQSIKVLEKKLNQTLFIRSTKNFFHYSLLESLYGIKISTSVPSPSQLYMEIPYSWPKCSFKRLSTFCIPMPV